MRRDKPSSHPASGRRHRVARNVGGTAITDELAPAMVDALADILRDETRGKSVA